MRWKAYPQYKYTGNQRVERIPQGWRISRLKNVARFAYGDSLASEDRVSGQYNVMGSNGVVGTHDQFNTKAPCLIVGRKGSFGKVTYSENPCFAIDTTYFIDEAKKENNLKWLYYCLQWLRLDAFSKDSAVPGLAREDAYENLIPICGHDEQKAIATFLDRETERIDNLIAKKERQIEFLIEKFKSLVNHVVTKGRTREVSLRQSGVKWLGMIPTHWELLPLRRVIKRFIDYRGKTPTKRESGIPLITASAVRNNRIDHSRCPDYISEDDYEKWMVRGLPETGDVVFTTEGATFGETAQIVDANVALAQRLILFKVDERRITNDFLFFHLLSAFGRGEQWSNVTGTTVYGIRADQLKATRVTVPPLREQNEIAVFLKQRMNETDSLVKTIRDSITLLQEYRTALISAAVSGKIDVRKEVVH